MVSPIDYFKKNPGEASFSSSAMGAMNHLASEWFRDLASVDIVYIPREDGPSGMTDVRAGHVQMAFNTLFTAMPRVKAGKRKTEQALNGPAAGFLAADPQSMTLLGCSTLAVKPANGIFRRSEITEEIMTRLDDALRQIQSRLAVQEKILASSQYPVIKTSDGVRSLMAKQTVHWARIVGIAEFEPQ